MSVSTAKTLNRIFSSPAWMLLLVLGLLALIACFLIRGKKKAIPIITCVLSLCLFLITLGIEGSAGQVIRQQAGSDPVMIKQDTPEFSRDTMFSLRIYEPWFYESLHYTLKNDGTLIVQYFNTELGREKLSDEKMEKIREIFSPEKVWSMDIGEEDDMTDGVRRYIVLYDSGENEIEIGGYELRGGDGFNSYFSHLYKLVQDDYTKQWSDLLDECARDQTTYGERYLNGSGDGQSGGDADPTPTPQASSGEPEMGIEYSYWLRLDRIPGESYEVDADDISYELVDYGNYISVYITNKGSKDVSIGGEYRLQRLIDGEYKDIEDDMNLKYGDVHVQDMPLIVMYDDLNGVELPLADEDGTFVIGAGQRVLANFLTLRYRIFDSPEYTGDYRLIYGDVVIDFKLFCDVVC